MTFTPSSGFMSFPLERTWQPEQMLGYVRENEIGRDRGDLIEPRLAEFAFDVVFVRKAEAAVELQACIGRLPGGVSREQLGHVGLRAGGLPGVEKLAGLVAHQACRF